MALKNMSLLTGATVATTGGTALPFTDNGVTIANGVQLVVSSDTDYQTKRVCTVKYKAPPVNPQTGAYGKDKKSLSYVIPQVLSDGSVVFNTLRIEREIHPAATAATVADMNKVGAQLLTDADLDGFWANGSLS